MTKKSEKQIHLFLDSNIYLSFYDFTNDELNKLSDLHKNERINLYITNLVIDEVWRNRANKIEYSLKKLKEKKFPTYPHYCLAYTECKALRKTQKKFEELWNKLFEKIKKNYLEQNLHADKKLKNFFKKTSNIEITDEMISRAQRRKTLGNPPGKNGSLGDAINWEFLLERVPKNAEFTIITRDGDYLSPLSAFEETGNKLHPFLEKEWEEKKLIKPLIFKTITEFSKHHDSVCVDIPSEEVARKDELIEALLNSGSFKETHDIIAELSEYDDFTNEEKKRIERAAHSNPQVGWIINDEDVQIFYKDKLNITSTGELGLWRG
ncbi:MAG: DUF4935 domain-containing protein [Alphaproteobacteria bacterium]|nr:DUF4935 domain-containing protein [Alphaproteobacteria bacterium]NCQ66444.1 DUF4935 domain-containing protein [Alphaproteobacteria bacterium]